MQFHVLSIGKCRDTAINALVAHYIERLKPFHPTQLHELPHGKGSSALIKQNEADTLHRKLPAGSLLIVLDERGKQLSSAAFAQTLKTFQEQGHGQLAFVIGGADGIAESLRGQARLVLSLSTLTLPHMLVRPVLLEQLYRAATINSGHPYHRE